MRFRCDRVSAFMVARAPHRLDANGLTVTLVVFDALAVGGEGPALHRRIAPGCGVPGAVALLGGV